jgi:hypothetical protein
MNDQEMQAQNAALNMEEQEINVRIAEQREVLSGLETARERVRLKQADLYVERFRLKTVEETHVQNPA